MNSTWPSRNRSNSWGCGSFTFTIMSAAAKTASASAAIVGAGGDEVLVGDRGARRPRRSRPRRVPAGDQLAHALGGRRHPELVVLDFLRDPDVHALALLSSVTPAQAYVNRVRPRVRRKRRAARRPSAARAPSSRRGPCPLRAASTIRANGSADELDPVLDRALRARRSTRAQNRCTYSSVEPGRRVVAAEELDRRVPVAGLLEQLARGARERVLAVDVEHARRGSR